MSTNLKRQTIELVSESPVPVVRVVDSHRPAISKRVIDPHPKNDLIPFKRVYVVDPETNTVAKEGTSLQTLLDSIDRKTHFVQLVSNQPLPLVKVVEQKADYRKRKSKRKAKAHSFETKDVQCTWSLASGDLQHKMQRVRMETAKGNRVNITFLPKNNVPVPPPRLRQQILNDALSFVQGDCKESQVRTIQGLRVTLHLEAASGHKDSR